MQVDKVKAMSSFLMYRSLLSSDLTFKENIKPFIADVNFDRTPINNSIELKKHLKKEITDITKDGKAALMLSGGIDSAILAKFMPKGSVAYTLKCIVPGMEVVDESKMAAKYAEECGLEHRIIEVYWEDYENTIEELMRKKGAPLHSIEPQIYKACLTAKKEGFKRLIFGENADIIYGGFDRLLSKDWTYGEFIERYSHVLPYKVLKNWELITSPFEKYEQDGFIKTHEFLNDVFRIESTGSYFNACETGNIGFIAPFTKTYLDAPLDYERVRNGESKYFIREIFNEQYNNIEIPKKTPMPRPVAEWLKDWKGPVREEFWPNCTVNMTGDQKWLVYILEKFLNMIEE